MKNWQFWVIIAIILIQSIFFYAKFKSIEEQQAKTYTEVILNAEDISHVKGDTETIIGILPDILN